MSDLTKENGDEYDIKFMERVKRKVIIDENGCWLWQGSLCEKGYGQIQYKDRSRRTHRKVFEVVNGVQLLEEQFVCHHCDVRRCCNPDHLWLGDNSANQRDAALKGRHQETKKTHCPQGHEYSAENTYNTSFGTRQCRKCTRERHKRLASKRRVA